MSEQVSDTGGASGVSAACSRERGRNSLVIDCSRLICLSSWMENSLLFLPRIPQRGAFLLHPAAAAFPLSLQHHSLERGFVINIPDVCADAGAAPESPE